MVFGLGVTSSLSCSASAPSPSPSWLNDEKPNTPLFTRQIVEFRFHSMNVKNIAHNSIKN